MILGIDPGIRKLWYALIHLDGTVEEAGILVEKEKNPTRVTQYRRMSEIYEFFQDLLKRFPKIQAVGMEKYFFTQFNKSNAEFVYGVRGILLQLAYTQKKQIYEYTPLEIKKRITGNSKAWKELVQKYVMRLYKLEEQPIYHDAADALAISRIVRSIQSTVHR